MGETDFTRQLAEKRKREVQKADDFKKASNERLFKIAATKIRTTMIGALATIEEKLAIFLTPNEGEKLTNEQMFIKKIYEEIRQEILDRGNTQIRNLENEFQQYDIEWKRYTLQLPVKIKE